MFDFVSLRYLYHGCNKDNEKHTVKPNSADLFTEVTESEETKISTSMDLKLAKDDLGGVHVARDGKLAYEKKSKSWRNGFSFESCKSDLLVMTTSTHNNEMCQFPTKKGDGQGQGLRKDIKIITSKLELPNTGFRGQNVDARTIQNPSMSAKPT